MERIFSILTRKAIKKHVASLLVVVLMLSQTMVAGAEVGSFTGESKRIKSTRGCQHNCWTDEGCQELLWQIMNTDPEAYEEIREEMLAYGWDDSGYGPGFATDSDADEIEDTEPEKATPSDADENTDGKATPSDADQQKPEKATPSDAYEKASDSDADEKINSKYRITDDGRLKLRACEHEHDDECGYYAWKTTYEYEDEEVKVKAVVVSENEEALPDGSELVVEKVTEPEDIEYIAQKIAEETGRLYDCSQAYDIRFEFGGDEVEPEDATVKVQLKYKEAVPVNEPGEVQAGEEAGNDIRVLHLTHDNQIEDVTGDISKNMAGDLKSATFETESFSIFVLTQVLPNGTFFQYEDEEKVITASVSNAAEIPSDAKLVVDVIGEEDEQYQAAKAQLEEIGSIVQTVEGTDLLMYDFYFLDTFDEKLIVPEDIEIQLNIQYLNPKPLMLNEMESKENVQSQIMAYQLRSDNSLNNLANSIQKSENGIQNISIRTFGSGSVVFNRGATDTGVKFDGDYTLMYILRNFNVFTLQNAHCGHTIGPVAVGGTGCFHSGIGGRNHFTNTFSKGGFRLLPLKSYDASWIHPSDTKGLPDYTPSNYPKTRVYVPSYLTSENLHMPSELLKTKVSYSDNYMDFTEAFEKIDSQIKLLGSGDINKLTGKNKETVTVGVYKADNINAIDVLDINTNAEGNVIIYSEQEDEVQLPLVTFDGGTFESYSKKLGGDIEYSEKGIGIVFVFPNATTVDAYKKQYKDRGLGHVVAPKALFETARTEGWQGGLGDYNGCVIAREIHAPTTEFHMHPYSGNLLETGIQIKIGKTVDRRTPSGDEKFTFVLYSMTKTQESFEFGKEIERVTNTGDVISFSPIEYKGEGTYYYRIDEVIPSVVDSDYVYDDSSYYVRVKIESVTDALAGSVSLQPTEITYWKCDKDGTQIIDDVNAIIPSEISLKTVIDLTTDPINPAVFRNSKKETTSIQFQAGKTVDGKAPTDIQKFNFTLQPLQKANSSSEVEITLDHVELTVSGTPDIKQNSIGIISFDSIPYTVAGDYYYKLYENSNENQPEAVQTGYTFDVNSYYIKVNVQDTNGKLSVNSVTYWKADAEKNLGSSNEMIGFTTNPVVVDLTTRAVFENKTNISVVLPETGSAGTRKFTYTGFWLFMMGLMGMMYSGQERKRKVRN